jgi:hypothetical protein
MFDLPAALYFGFSEPKRRRIDTPRRRGITLEASSYFRLRCAPLSPAPELSQGDLSDHDRIGVC